MTYYIISYYKDNLSIIITRESMFGDDVSHLSIEFNNSPKAIPLIMSKIFARRSERQRQINEEVNKQMMKMANKHQRYTPPTNVHGFRTRVKRSHY